jgi:sodium-dependent dicarboxylate transporter 2/3/5
MDTGAVTAEYGNQIIFLFIGGFLIAITMEKWNLHTRIALLIIGLIGTSPRRIIAGFLVATAFISAWISNSATAMMMLPVALAVTLKMRGDAYESTFRTALMLSVAYGASIGGIATLIGSPPNMILAGMSRTITGSEITFLTWASFGVPIACILLVLCWIYLVYIAFPQKAEHAVISIAEEIRSLGPVSVEERRVLAVFFLVAFLWISRTFWGPYLPMVTDSVIAVFGAVTLFMVPARENKRLLGWEDALHLPWNIVLLFGCGFAIAQGFVETGLGAWTADQLHFLAGVPPLLVLLAVIILVLFVTEITSNTATATIFIPITAVLASVSGIEPLFLMIPAAIASSLAFMLPVSTPPNAIVYGTGYVTMSQMIRAGFWMNCISIIVLMIAVPLFVP